MAKAVRSLEWRRKHAVIMHRMVSKLLQLRKRKALQHAKPSDLKKRANHLANSMLKKRVAGAQGVNYAKLTSSEKMAVDRLMQRIPASAVQKLAKKLIPVVTKHEKERLAMARKSHAAKVASAATPREISEASIYKQIMHASVKTARTAHRRHKRSQSVIDTTSRGAGKKTRNLLASREAVKAILKRLGRGGGKKTPYGEIARKLMRRALSKGNATSANIRKRIHDLKDKTRKSVQSHKGMKGHGHTARQYLGRGKVLTASYDIELDCFADMLVERNMEKFEDLFIRGLVPRSKVEIYKRIFDDLEQNVRLRRYHGDLINLIDTMINLLTTDPTIYYRVRSKLQQNRVT